MCSAASGRCSGHALADRVLSVRRSLPFLVPHIRDPQGHVRLPPPGFCFVSKHSCSHKTHHGANHQPHGQSKESREHVGSGAARPEARAMQAFGKRSFGGFFVHTLLTNMRPDPRAHKESLCVCDHHLLLPSLRTCCFCFLFSFAEPRGADAVSGAFLHNTPAHHGPPPHALESTLQTPHTDRREWGGITPPTPPQ